LSQKELRLEAIRQFMAECMNLPGLEEMRQYLATYEPAGAPREGYYLKRICMMMGALTTLQSGEFSVFDRPGQVEYNETRAGFLFKELAAGNVDAEAALCLIAGALLRRDKKLPPLLRTFAADVLLKKASSIPPRGRGTDPYSKAARDAYIVMAVQAVRQKLGIHATRNDAVIGQETACSMVAAALGMAERGVVKIWAKRKQFGLD